MAVNTSKTPTKTLNLFYLAKAVDSSLTAGAIATLINLDSASKKIIRKEYKERTVYNTMHGLISDGVIDEMLQDIIDGKVVPSEALTP